jgi:MFS transporter, FHS family, L-fucose permease
MNRKFIYPMAVIGIMFFVIGFGVGISGFLTPALKSGFSLTSAESYLITAAIFSAFVIFGAPSGWLIKKIGYRRSMMIAFLIMAAGMFLFIPAARSLKFPLFIAALFVGGIGNTLLQASVNPYVTIFGPVESAAKRMSFMGIMNKTAWWFAPVFLGIFIDLRDVQVNDVILPFTIAGSILLVLAVFTFFSSLPEIDLEKNNEPEVPDEGEVRTSKTSILQFPHLLLGALALFIYVGLETLPMASAIDFARFAFPEHPSPEGFAKFVTIGMIIGYLFGVTAIPRLISQKNALILFTVIALFSSSILIAAPVKYSFFAITGITFANSIMWPAIWPLAISGLGKFSQQGASILVMAISGGAVIPILYGIIVDSLEKTSTLPQVLNYQKAYLILLPGYLYIMYYALKGHMAGRKKTIKTN